MDTTARSIFTLINGKLLKSGLFVIFSLAFLGLACGSNGSLLDPPTPCAGADCLTQPLVIESVDGILDATFTVAIVQHANPYSQFESSSDSSKSCKGNQAKKLPSYCVNRHGKDQSLELRTFGAMNPDSGEVEWAFPGPTLRVKRGDTVNLLTKNEIVDNDPTPTKDGCDARLDENPSGATSTAPKLGVAPNCFRGDNNTNIHFHGSHVTPDGTGDNVLIEIKPGEVQRWRMISATQQTSAQIDEFKFTDAAGGDADIKIRQIAADGIEFLDDQYQNVIKNPKKFLEIDLAPGNRADFLVQAPTTTGTYLLQAPRREGRQQESGRISEDSILRIEVTGKPVVMKFPEHLRTFEDLPEGQQKAMESIIGDSVNIAKHRVLKFKQSGGPAAVDNPPRFTIDDKMFDPDRVDQQMVLTTTEQWKIENYTQTKHPFHIHVNPFFITHYFDPTTSTCDPTDLECTKLADDDPQRRWQDTIALPEAKGVTPGYVIIRQRYLDFTGKYVLHCHILGHEDRGMMQLVEVVPNS